MAVERTMCRIFAAAASLSLSACGTLFTGSPASNPGGEESQAALHYFVPEDVVEVVATMERTTVTKLKGELTSPRPETSESLAVASAIVNLQTVADTSKPYVLDAEASGLAKNNTALTVSETGLLQSVNAKVSGTGGIVFENVMKLAGTVLPLVNLVSGGISAGPKPPVFDPTVMLKEASRTFVHAPYMSLSSSTQPAIQADECDDAYVLRQLPQTQDYYFAFDKLAGKTQLVKDYCETADALESRRQNYRNTLAQFDKEEDGNKLGILKNKLGILRDEYYTAVGAHKAARDSIAQAVTQHVQDAGIGKKVARYTSRDVLRFSDLPDVSLVQALNKPPAASEDELLTRVRALEGRRALKSLYESTGVIVTATPMAEFPVVVKAGKQVSETPAAATEPKASGANPAAATSSNGHGAESGTNGQSVPDDAGPSSDAHPPSSQAGATDAPKTGVEASPCKPNGAKTSTPCVFYRTPRSYLLTAWTTQKVLENDSSGGIKSRVRLLPGDSKIVDAIPDTAPVRMIELRESSWTKRDSTLTFSPRGRLTGVTRDYGSAAADASGSIASGLSSGITSYQTTLTSLKAIRDTENQIKLQPLQQQLAVANAYASLELQPLQHELAMATTQSQIDLQAVQAQVNLAQQQVALINQQVSLQAATAGQNAALEAQLTNIQNTLIGAQRALTDSQAQLASAQAMGQNAAERGDLAASSAMLQAQIQQLSNEIALLKLKEQIAEMKNAKP